MKRPYLLVLLLSILLSSCQEDAVVLSREYLVQGNWEQFMVTDSYYDQEDKLQDIVQKPSSKAVRISKNKLDWGSHSDAYTLQGDGGKEYVYQHCQELPAKNSIKGASNEYPDWMLWTSEQENVTYETNSSTRMASKVVRTIHFRRVKVVK